MEANRHVKERRKKPSRTPKALHKKRRQSLKVDDQTKQVPVMCESGKDVEEGGLSSQFTRKHAGPGIRDVLDHEPSSKRKKLTPYHGSLASHTHFKGLKEKDSSSSRGVDITQGVKSQRKRGLSTDYEHQLDDSNSPSKRIRSLCPENDTSQRIDNIGSTLHSANMTTLQSRMYGSQLQASNDNRQGENVSDVSGLILPSSTVDSSPKDNSPIKSLPQCKPLKSIQSQGENGHLDDHQRKPKGVKVEKKAGIRRSKSVREPGQKSLLNIWYNTDDNDSEEEPKSPDSSKKTARRQVCGKCPVCLLPDCGECKYCIDKKSSHPVLKQACIHKQLEKCYKYRYGDVDMWPESSFTKTVQDNPKGERSVLTNQNSPESMKTDSDGGNNSDTSEQTEDVSSHDDNEVQASHNDTVHTPDRLSDSDSDSSETAIDRPKRTKIMKRALKYGSVKVFSTKCSITGPPGSGKSHVRALVLNGNRPPERNSTPIATEAAQAMVCDKDHFMQEDVVFAEVSDVYGRWHVVDSEYMTDLVAGTIADPGELKFDKSKDVSDTNPESESLPHSRQVIKSVNLSKISRKIKGFMRNSPTKPGQRRVRFLTDLHLIYLVDTGGQPQFQEILPMFVRNSSVNIFVFKLSQTLNERPQFEYVINGKHLSESEEMKMSNIDILFHSARSVYSSTQGCAINRALKTPDHPLMVLLGTFKDKISESGETLDQKQQQLARKLSPFIKNKLGRCKLVSRSRTQPIYEIDASKDGWTTNNLILKDIRHKITEMSEKLVIEIPVWWFVFLVDLKDIKSNFVTIEQCYELASQSSGHVMEKEEVDEALRYFDELNMILFFPGILPDIVFHNPNFLLLLVSEIIVTSFETQGSDLMMVEREHFRDEGIFTQELLQSSMSKDSFDKHFTQAKFLRLLQDLLIVANVGDGHYFMPCVLPLDCTLPVSDQSSQSNQSDKLKEEMQELEIDPFCISFGCDYSPRGLFCATIVHLTKNESWVLRPFEGLVRKRNLIEFEVKLPQNDCETSLNKSAVIGTVAISESEELSQFIVYSTCEKGHCSMIKCAIYEALKKAIDTLSYNPKLLEISAGFSCTSNCEEKCEHVAAVLNDNKTGRFLLKCRKKIRRKAWKLNSSQEVWFADGILDVYASRTNRLTENEHFSEIYTTLSKHVCKWKEIGRHLGFNQCELDQIEQEKKVPGGLDECLSCMISKWLEWAPQDGRGSKNFATFEDLELALFNVGLGATAHDLKQKVLSHT